MKVCFIVPPVTQAVSGGLSVQVTNTASALKEQGISVTLFNPWERYDWKQFDLAHIFKADYDTYNMAMFLKDSGIPYVTTPVFYATQKPFQIRSLRNLTTLARKAFSGIRTDLDCIHDICTYSKKVLPNTHEEKKFLEKGIEIASHKISVIPNGVEEHFQDSAPSLFIQKYGINDFILSVGNFGYRRKNMLKLLEVLETIDHPAVLIGKIYNNPYGTRCRKKIEKLKHVLWIDALDHDDPLLASAYAASKVFVLPSTFETPGLVALEAAVAGSNIVITPHGGPKEYFGSMAEYMDPDDIESIKGAIISALQKEYNTALKKHILANYSYKAIAEKIIGVYTETANA